MEIHQMAILSDNYSHLIVDRDRGTVAAVDPAEPPKLLEWLNGEGLRLTEILCTHHHWDHAGGNEALLQVYPQAHVYAGANDAEKVHGVTHTVTGGDVFQLGGRDVQVLGVPCHTRGHVAYLWDGNLFCGDTLFVAGCGRFFEGEAREMDEALNHVFGALPGSTKVYCGHEYTVSNLLFAQSVEPDNLQVQEKLIWAQQRRDNGLSTVPSTLEEEWSYNPFMRVRVPGIQKRVGQDEPVPVMKALRELKNDFRPPVV